MTSAEICKKNKWGVGDVLESSADRVRITAIGKSEVLVESLTRHTESLWESCHVWVLVTDKPQGDGKWRDEATGLVWLPTERGTYTYEEALKLETEEKRLPTIGELRMAWEHDSFEVFKEDLWLWSSSVHPDVPSSAYVLTERSGYIGLYNRYNIDSVRLVIR